MEHLLALVLLLNTGATSVNDFFPRKAKKTLLPVGSGPTVGKKGGFVMNYKKKNVSLPADLHEYIVERESAINEAGKKTGVSTTYSAQVALAVARLKEDEPLSFEGNSPAPHPGGRAETARTSGPYTNPRQPKKTKRL
jgi:hypothetical protein